MTDDEQLFLEAMQAFQRGYSGPPGVINSRRVGRTAAGVRAVVHVLMAKRSGAQALPSARPENSDVNDEPWDAGYERGWNACLAAAGSATAPPSAEPAEPEGSTVLSAEGAHLIAQAIAAHAAVARFLVDGRPDLALAESMKWVEGFARAAEIVAAAPEAPHG